MRTETDKKKWLLARQRTKKLLATALLAAMAWIFLSAAAWLPQAALSLRLGSAFVILVAQLRFGTGAAASCYFVAALLGLLLPGYFLALPFLIYFGPYIPLCSLINRYSPSKIALYLRLLLGTALAYLLLSLYQGGLFNPRLLAKLGTSLPWLLPLLGLLFTAFFEYLLNLAACFYQQRLQPFLGK